jgi:hypothetical protein
MDKLATLLIDGGVITKAQLETVEQKQRVFGGSLALNLLIEDVLPERVIQVFLAQLLGNPGAQPYDVDPDPDALSLLDRDRAARLRIIPIRVVGDVLHVFTPDPANQEAIHEIARRTEKTVVPSLVNELRYLWLLDRWYGIECPPRAAKAARRLFEAEESFSSILDSEDDDSLIYDPLAGAAPGLPGLKGLIDSMSMDEDNVLEAENEIIPILEEELPLLVIDSPEVEQQALEREQKSRNLPVGHGLDPLPPSEFDMTLAAVETLEEVFTAFLRFGGPYFKSLSAFKVQGGMIMGWRSAGEGVDAERIRGIVVPMSGDSVLAKAIAPKPFVSEERSSPLDQRVTEQMGCADDDVILCHAISVLTRPVLVICGTLKVDVDRTRLMREFEALCEQASAAVVRIIMRKKREEKKRQRGRKKKKRRRKSKPPQEPSSD